MNKLNGLFQCSNKEKADIDMVVEGSMGLIKMNFEDIKSEEQYPLCKDKLKNYILRYLVDLRYGKWVE